MIRNFFKKLGNEIGIYELMSKSPQNNVSNHAFNILSVLKFMQLRLNWYDNETDFNMAYNDAVQEMIEAEEQKYNNLPEHKKPAPFVFR
jgi:hypothetical protein